MLRTSIKQIPKWGSRTIDEHIAINTIWGRNHGLVDTLIYTLVHDKTCFLEEECWYRDYISLFAKSTLYTDLGDLKRYVPEKIKEIDLGTGELVRKMDYSYGLTNEGFYEVGWMHIDADIILLSEELIRRFEEVHSSELDEQVMLYVYPKGLSESQEIAIWNDEKGNLYIEAID